MKTIYAKLISSFIITILLSMIIAFYFVTAFNKRDIQHNLATNMKSVAYEFIQLYGKENAQQAVSFFTNMSFTGYTFIIYDELLQKQEVGERTIQATIHEEDIVKVLNGEEHTNYVKGVNPPFNSIIGVPFEEQGKQYALFVLSNPEKQIRSSRKIQLTQLAFVLIIGSLFFLYISKLLVQPIKELIKATEEVGNGNYKVEIPVTSKDEIGSLTSHFNKMTKELSKIEQMRQDFVAGVSHEIQSPLTSIHGFAKALKNNEIDQQAKMEYLTIIEQESTRLSQLGGNLLKLASLDSEHHPFTLVRYRVDEQIRRVITSLAPQWEAKELLLNIQLPETYFKGDEDLLEQVWVNLLNNAIKFTPRLGSIDINLTTDESKVTCSITDTGPGIPEEDLKYLFEQFYKTDHSRSSRGSGLGLAIVKKIVEMHGGQTMAISELNNGSTFVVTLPINQENEK
ncbi:HAMP domain-containing sensor histidine kinase [Cytobacillus sp. IB215665]|uniref:sensor histidine kinase n=1 Tax=Cytobacillus sp. IB215665 TaxID=3097357 RepID=UPI002A149833|nr:HAMP domain-containing sensor histidine kinase [Cytobacillus sp. IB215665]MDX8366300.1 HAMP domain-containing sensor histidine kinase [Cytobacillus sp. IB215665]